MAKLGNTHVRFRNIESQASDTTPILCFKKTSLEDAEQIIDAQVYFCGKDVILGSFLQNAS